MRTVIRSITYPGYTEELVWVKQPKNRIVAVPVTNVEEQLDGRWMADVEHDWRIWVDILTGVAFVRNLGELETKEYPDLDAALASIDFKVEK